MNCKVLQKFINLHRPNIIRMCVNQNQDGGMQGSADAVRASTYHNV